MLKNNKGITTTVLVVTVIVLLLIIGTLSYSAVDSVKVRKLNELYDDLRQLDDAVEIYYLKNGKLPIDNSKAEIVVNKNEARNSVENKKVGFVLNNDATEVLNYTSFFNPNDYDVTSEKAVYKFLKVNLLDNITLNFSSSEYIINTRSHTIYNYSGIKIYKVTYNFLPLKYNYIQYNP